MNVRVLLDEIFGTNNNWNRPIFNTRLVTEIYSIVYI